MNLNNKGVTLELSLLNKKYLHGTYCNLNIYFKLYIIRIQTSDFNSRRQIKIGSSSVIFLIFKSIYVVKNSELPAVESQSAKSLFQNS